MPQAEERARECFRAWRSESPWAWRPGEFALRSPEKTAQAWPRERSASGPRPGKAEGGTSARARSFPWGAPGRIPAPGAIGNGPEGAPGNGLDLRICAGASRERSGSSSRNRSWKRCGPRSQAQAILGVTPSAALWAAPRIPPGGAPGLAPEPKAIFLAIPEPLRGALLEITPVSPRSRRRADWRSNSRRSPRTTPGLELPGNHCPAEPTAQPRR